MPETHCESFEEMKISMKKRKKRNRIISLVFIIVIIIVVACIIWFKYANKSNDSNNYEITNEEYLEYINIKDTSFIPFPHFPTGFVDQADTMNEWYGEILNNNTYNELVRRLEYRTTFLRDSVNEYGACQIVFETHKDSVHPYVFAVGLPNNIVSEYIEIGFLDSDSNLVVMDKEKGFNMVCAPLDKERTLLNEEGAIMRLGEVLYFKSYICNQAICLLRNSNDKRIDLFEMCLSNSTMLISFKYSNDESYILQIPLKSFKSKYNAQS